MRIAAHRSTISAQATAPEASTKPAGASFFEALAGASAQPSNGAAVPAVNSAPQHDSNAAGQNPQTSSGPDANTQVRPENDQLQNIVLPVASKSNSVQASAPQTPAASDGSRTNRAAAGDEKTQATAAVPTVYTTVPVTVPPVETVPVSALPSPSPSSSVQSAGNSNVQKSAPTVAVKEGQTAATDNNAALAAQVSISGQNRPAAHGTEFALETPDVLPDAATQPDQPAGSPARAVQAANNGQNQPSVQNTKLAVEIFDSSLASATQPEQPQDSSSTQSSGAADSSPQQTVSSAALPLTGLMLSNFGISPSANDSTVSGTTAAQSSKASNVNLTKVAVNGNGTASATGGSQATPAAATTGTSTHGTQSNTQNNAQNGAQNNSQNSGSGQHAQGQTTQNQPAPQAPANSTSATPQMQTVAGHSTTHDGFASHFGGDVTADSTRASERAAQPEINEPLTTSGINTANVIQKMSETEMRVGIHSAEFGDISIRTTVSQQQMMTEISVDHGDLGKAISAHIPTLEAKLGGELGLRALVQVSQSGMSFSGERNSSPQREQRSFAQPAAIEGVASSLETDTVLPRAALAASSQYRSDRLDIRA